MATSTRSGKSDTVSFTTGSGFPFRPASENASSQASAAACESACCAPRDSPARSPACATTASTAASSRSSLCNTNSIRDGSALMTSAHRSPLVHVAGFAAIRAIVESVDAHPDILLRLAEAAIFFARALSFRLVTLRTQGNHCGPLPAEPGWLHSLNNSRTCESSRQAASRAGFLTLENTHASLILLSETLRSFQ